MAGKKIVAIDMALSSLRAELSSFPFSGIYYPPVFNATQSSEEKIRAITTYVSELSAGVRDWSDRAAQVEREFHNQKNDVAALRRLFGIPPSAPAPAETVLTLSTLQPHHLKELRELVAAGLKIDAIKRARQLTGCGLKEAKEFVVDRDLTL